jgi:nucleotidyltransferase substrate binding protein (TIGR01987 family)
MKSTSAELEKVINTLDEALHFALLSKEEMQFKIARDACIQRFEYCIELAWKVSMKVLGSKTAAAKPAIREMARADLISSAEQWLDFIEARNNSSHSYDEETAAKVYLQIQDFSVQSKDLLKKLEKQK